jgi:hypothetical protein
MLTKKLLPALVLTLLIAIPSFAQQKPGTIAGISDALEWSSEGV